MPQVDQAGAQRLCDYLMTLPVVQVEKVIISLTSSSSSAELAVHSPEVLVIASTVKELNLDAPTFFSGLTLYREKLRASKAGSFGDFMSLSPNVCHGRIISGVFFATTAAWFLGRLLGNQTNEQSASVGGGALLLTWPLYMPSMWDFMTGLSPLWVMATGALIGSAFSLDYLAGALLGMASLSVFVTMTHAKSAPVRIASSLIGLSGFLSCLGYLSQVENLDNLDRMVLPLASIVLTIPGGVILLNNLVYSVVTGLVNSMTTSMAVAGATLNCFKNLSMNMARAFGEGLARTRENRALRLAQEEVKILKESKERDRAEIERLKTANQSRVNATEKDAVKDQIIRDLQQVASGAKKQYEAKMSELDRATAASHKASASAQTNLTKIQELEKQLKDLRVAHHQVTQARDDLGVLLGQKDQAIEGLKRDLDLQAQELVLARGGRADLLDQISVLEKHRAELIKVDHPTARIDVSVQTEAVDSGSSSGPGSEGRLELSDSEQPFASSSSAGSRDSSESGSSQRGSSLGQTMATENMETVAGQERVILELRALVDRLQKEAGALHCEVGGLKVVRTQDFQKFHETHAQLNLELEALRARCFELEHQLGAANQELWRLNNLFYSASVHQGPPLPRTRPARAPASLSTTVTAAVFSPRASAQPAGVSGSTPLSGSAGSAAQPSTQSSTQSSDSSVVPS